VLCPAAIRRAEKELGRVRRSNFVKQQSQWRTCPMTHLIFNQLKKIDHDELSQLPMGGSKGAGLGILVVWSSRQHQSIWIQS
jgi:hypothetical protein